MKVLFIGGTGTSATVVSLVEFLSSAREALGIRLISIDRPGYGSAPLDPELDDYPPVVRPESRPLQLALSNSFGFGGTNAVLVLSAA